MEKNYLIPLSTVEDAEVWENHKIFMKEYIKTRMFELNPHMALINLSKC